MREISCSPDKTWGASDYEYWLYIAAADKDLVLLALIQKMYSGNEKVVTEFKSFLTSKHIPCKFGSYV